MAVSIALKHLQSETPSPKRWNAAIPQSVENIILKATAKDSYYRYESVDAMEEDIRTALDPSRINEPPFVIPEDQDATKAIPIITNDFLNSMDETIIREPEKQTLVFENKEDHLLKSEKQNKQKGKPKDKKIRKKGPVILISSFIILLFLIILVFALSPSILGTKEVTVPELQGKEYDAAITELLNLGLVIGKTIKIEDVQIPEGQVIKTNPIAGRKVKEGATIDIYQSSGKNKITLINYEGKNLKDVEPILEEMKFKDIVVTEKYSSNFESGMIMTQNPAVNSEVIPEDTVIEFTVSKGSNQISLKDLTGYSEAGLKDYAKESGLKIEIDKEEYNSSIAVGQVISQTPSAHSKVDKGTTVKVILSKGKEDVLPKTITREIQIEYKPVQPGKAQLIKIYIEDLTRNINEPVESVYIMETIKRKLEFTVTKDQPARYKVMRDDKVIYDEVVHE